MAQTIYYGDNGGSLLNLKAGTTYETGFNFNRTGAVNGNPFDITQLTKTGYTTPVYVGMPIAVKLSINGVPFPEYRGQVSSFTANTINITNPTYLYNITYSNTATYTIQIAQTCCDILDTTNFFSTLATQGGCSCFGFTVVPGTRFVGTYNPGAGDILVMTTDFCSGGNNAASVTYGPNPNPFNVTTSAAVTGAVQALNYNTTGCLAIIVGGTWQDVILSWRPSYAYIGTAQNVKDFTIPAQINGNVSIYGGSVINGGQFNGNVTLKSSTSTGVVPTIAGGQFYGIVTRDAPRTGFYNVIYGTATYGPTATMSLYADGRLNTSNIPQDPGFALGGGTFAPYITFPANTYPSPSKVLNGTPFGPTSGSIGALAASGGTLPQKAGFSF